MKKAELKDEFDINFLYFGISSATLVISILFLGDPQRIFLVVAAMLGIAYSFFNIAKLFEKVQKVSLGCEGEEYTGQELNLLMRKKAFVFHDIPYQYGNIDHVVIGNNRIFAVETKSVRKPIKHDTDSSRQSTVKFDGKSLIFPHFKTTAPIEQAKRHAVHIQRTIKNKCGVIFPTLPVVALPGWHIEIVTPSNTDILVINPKRAKALHKWLGEVQDKEKRNKVVNYIASVARSVSPSSKRLDPDAAKHYDIWQNPRYKEKLLGDE